MQESISAVAAAMVAVAGSTGMWWFLRDWLRHRRERSRFADVERLLGKTGVDKVDSVIALTRAIIVDGVSGRNDVESSVAGGSQVEGGPPAGGVG